MTKDEETRVFICIAGGSNQSRMSITRRFIIGHDDSNTNSTNQDINSKHCQIDGRTIKIDIIDKSTQDSLAEMRHRYYQEVDGFVFVIDVNNPASIEEFKIIYMDASTARNQKKGSLYGVIAAYDDYSTDQKAIPIEKIKVIGREFKCSVFEASSKTTENIPELFNELIRKILLHKQANPNKTQETSGACCSIY